MLNPPIPGVYTTSEQLITAVNEHAKQEGYAVVKQRTKKDKNGLSKVYLKCDRGGKYVDRSSGLGSRKITGTRLVDYPFSVTGTRKGESWYLDIRVPGHNHDASSSVSAHPVHRRISSQVKQSIEALSKSGIQPKDIISSLRQEDPDLAILPGDVYNAQKQIRLENLGPHTPIQALLYKLQAESGQYMLRYRLNEQQQVTHLFFSHRDSQLLLQENPDVLLADCTYKTNRFNLPLMNVVGSTGLNTTFYVGFGFMIGETEADYVWILEVLQALYQEFGRFGPGVMVTDRDLALMAALRRVFPTTKGLLCVWHVNKNVLARISQEFKEIDKRDEFMTAWNTVMGAETMDEYTSSWQSLQQRFRAHPRVLQYLRDQWIPYRSQIVKAWTNRYFHLGNTSTSRVEGAHSRLKNYIRVSTGDLKTVTDSITLLLTAQYKDYRATQEIARLRPPHEVNIPLFIDLIGRVTPYALQKILEQYKRIQTGPLLPCTTVFSKTMGLPCAHWIWNRLYDPTLPRVHLLDVHSHWYFDRHLDTSTTTHQYDSVLLAQNPPTIRSRGRPPRSTQSVNLPTSSNLPKCSTRRDPSQFEITIAATTTQTWTRRQRQIAEQEQALGTEQCAETIILAPKPQTRDLRASRSQKGTVLGPSEGGVKKSHPGRNKNKQTTSTVRFEDIRTDPKEDALVDVELARLHRTNGEARPLWVEKFPAMTRAASAWVNQTDDEVISEQEQRVVAFALEEHPVAVRSSQRLAAKRGT